MWWQKEEIWKFFPEQIKRNNSFYRMFILSCMLVCISFCHVCLHTFHSFMYDCMHFILSCMFAYISFIHVCLHTFQFIMYACTHFILSCMLCIYFILHFFTYKEIPLHTISFTYQALKSVIYRFINWIQSFLKKNILGYTVQSW